MRREKAGLGRRGGAGSLVGQEVECPGLDDMGRGEGGEGSLMVGSHS